MKVASNVIKDAFGASMKAGGFQRKGDNWYRVEEEVVLVANLQRSSFGNQYYVNLGIWLNALGDPAFPKENQCHVRVRATALDPDRASYWERQVFNLEHEGLEPPVRYEMVQSFLQTIAITFLLGCSSQARLKELFRVGRLRSAAILLSARKILES